MKLVIDIPEEDYIRLKEKGMFGRVDVFKKAVREAIPLPKGHGNLIDINDLKSEIIECTEINLVDWRDIENANVIIEADKEG